MSTVNSTGVVWQGAEPTGDNLEIIGYLNAFNPVPVDWCLEETRVDIAIETPNYVPYIRSMFDSQPENKQSLWLAEEEKGSENKEPTISSDKGERREREEQSRSNQARLTKSFQHSLDGISVRGSGDITGFPAQGRAPQVFTRHNSFQRPRYLMPLHFIRGVVPPTAGVEMSGWFASQERTIWFSIPQSDTTILHGIV